MRDFRDVRVLVVGDVMLDRYLYGQVDRISPEAPVPVVRLRRTRSMPGGAGNVARNVAALGGSATLVGLIGRDPAGAELRERLAGEAGVVDACVASARPTSCKMRIVAGTQQVARLDEEQTEPADAEEAAALIAASIAALHGAGIVVLSDYAKGVLTREVVAAVCAAAAAAGVPVLADPKRTDFGHYAGAQLLTPNARELAAATGLPTGTTAAVATAARAAIAASGVPALLCTRAERGMILVTAGGTVAGVPAAAREVFDVSGAGDTALAALALAHAAGAPLVEAMRVANAAAGVVVGKLGTATVTPDELALALDGGAPPALLDRAALLARVRAWRQDGLRVGFTNGCFDLLHAGHVALLRAARSRCDRLVVGLNDDASVSRLKGPARPINPLADRAAVIGALAAVDAVSAFGEDTPLALIEAVLPDVLVKGADYTFDQVVGAEQVRAGGGEVILVELLPGRSTTGMLAKRGPG